MSWVYWQKLAIYLVIMAGLIWSVLSYFFRSGELEIRREQQRKWISRALSEYQREEIYKIDVIDCEPEPLCNPPDGWCYYGDNLCADYFCTGKGDIVIPRPWFWEEDPDNVQ